MEFSVAGRLENGSIIAEVTVPKADETTQYAYYLCEKNQGVLEKRMYTGETTCSFQPPCAGQYYVRAYVRWREAGSPDYTIVAKTPSSSEFTAPSICAMRSWSRKIFRRSAAFFMTSCGMAFTMNFLFNPSRKALRLSFWVPAM